MEQHELRPPRGAKKNRKRIGRGNASGHGTYSGKGLKGQQSRSGYKTRPGFEGGQTPMIRRLPRRRGFTNPFRVDYVPVNLRDLSAFAADSEVTPESLRDAGIVRSIRQPIKILGDGELSAALIVKTHRVSAAARTKIEAAGGSVEELTPRQDPSEKRQRGKKKKAPALDAGGADQDTPALDAGGADQETPSAEGDAALPEANAADEDSAEGWRGERRCAGARRCRRGPRGLE